MSQLLNPVQKKIAAGMSPLVAYLTEATCGEACWEAREDVCRCSCGGKNHGCMRTADGIRPARTAKIDGVRYVLKAVAVNVYESAEAINKTSKNHVKIGTYEHDYPWSTTDKGAPARVKNATKDQLARWPELASFRSEIQTLQARRHAPIEVYRAWPQLLWMREDISTGETK